MTIIKTLGQLATANLFMGLLIGCAPGLILNSTVDPELQTGVQTTLQPTPTPP